jgi:hypothetical protein
VSPINDDGTAAWVLRTLSANIPIHYRIKADEGLDPKLIAEAKTKGWVLRARIKVAGDEPPREYLGHCTYRDDAREWILRPAMNDDGNQCLILPGQSSLGTDAVVAIPDSHNRYVDYEVRYQPVTDDADVYVNGRLVATGYYDVDRGSSNRLHFGTTRKRASEMRVASVEWGILDKNPGAKMPPQVDP